MEYQELIMNKASLEIRELLSTSSDDFKDEWDGLIYFPTNEDNEPKGPAINESALAILDEDRRKRLREIKETYFGK